MTRAEMLEKLRKILEDIYFIGAYTSQTQRQLNSCFALIGRLEKIDEPLETQVDQIMRELDDMHAVQPDSDFPLRDTREEDEREAFNERFNQHFNER